MKELGIAVAVITLIGLTFVGGFNQDEAQSKAVQRWKERGFEAFNYEGYQFGWGVRFTRYGGAKVWHSLRKIPDNGITYTGYVQQWGDETQLYGPIAIDAIKP